MSTEEKFRAAHERVKVLRAAVERLADALINGEDLHETDEDGEVMCGWYDGDGCDCELVTLINKALAPWP